MADNEQRCVRDDSRGVNVCVGHVCFFGEREENKGPRSHCWLEGFGERERERERESVCMCVGACVFVGVRVCVCPRALCAFLMDSAFVATLRVTCTCTNTDKLKHTHISTYKSVGFTIFKRTVAKP